MIEGFVVVFISWTVNGLRISMEKGVTDFYQGHKPDLFFLQETKIEQGQTNLPWGEHSEAGYLTQRGDYYEIA